MGEVKTTVDVHDELLKRAKRHARETGQTLRAVIEEGLRLVLEKPPPTGYKLPDLRVGNPGDPNPLEHLTWDEMLELMYGDRSGEWIPGQ